MKLVRHTLVTGAFVENGYVIHAEGRQDAVVIDPGAEPEGWLRLLAERGLRPVAILGTHGHLDHVGAVAAIQARHGSPYLVHADEVQMLEHLPLQCRLFGLPPFDPPRVSGHVQDGKTLTPAGFPIRIVATPGHTPGGTSYHVPDLGTVFTGDTLFAGTIGRTDLPGGDHRLLLRSLERLVAALPEETVVASGHGPETTIGEERDENPFLQ